jgi:5,10-methylenetetrahydromethanopterin reductase
MRIGLHSTAFALDPFLARVDAAERVGVSHLWVTDSPMTALDAYAVLTVAALRTRRMILATGATNVVTRHESVVAGALMTIDELAPGRVVCGVASGHTSVRLVGARPSSVADLRTAIVHIRALVNGEPVRYGNREVRISWPPRRLPVYLIAEGQRMLEMGAEVADGVVSGNGISPEVLDWIEDRISLGTDRAARPRSDVDVWHSCVLAIDDSPDAARRLASSRVTNRAMHNFEAVPELIPEKHRDECHRLMENFDLNTWYDARHVRYVTDYMLDRFAITGDAGTVVKKLRKLERRGVTSLMLDLPMNDFDEQLERLGEILPAL